MLLSFLLCTSDSNGLYVDREQDTVVESSRSLYDLYMQQELQNNGMNTLKRCSVPYHKLYKKLLFKLN